MPLDAGFKSMLTTTALLSRKTGKDQWGNEAWADDEPLACFVTDQSSSLGGEDQEKAEGETVVNMSIITDAYGAKLNDRVTVGSIVTYVTNIDTPKDEVGVDLMHTLSTTTAQKG